MIVPRRLEPLFERDASSDAAIDAEAAMKAYQAGIAYAINFIVLYLVLTLTVVALVGFMGFVASKRIRRSPVFAILAFASALCVAAAAINISQNRDLVVEPQHGVDRIRYTALIAVSFLIPFLCDFTLILRILAFYPPNATNRWKPYLAIAFPSLVKLPRFVFIVMYIDFCWKATKGAPDMLTITHRVNQVQDAVVEWSLMLADQLYCTAFLTYKLYGLGWGWGDEKHVGGSLLDTLRTIIISALACFAIPSFFLLTLIVMQAIKFRPDTEGYIFVVTIHLCIAGSALACLWPAIRADRRDPQPDARTPSHCPSCHTTGLASHLDTDPQKTSTEPPAAQRGSVRKCEWASATTSGEDLLETAGPPALAYRAEGQHGRSTGGVAGCRLPRYFSTRLGRGAGGGWGRGDEEAAMEMARQGGAGRGSASTERGASEEDGGGAAGRKSGWDAVGADADAICIDRASCDIGVTSISVPDQQRSHGLNHRHDATADAGTETDEQRRGETPSSVRLAPHAAPASRQNSSSSRSHPAGLDGSDRAGVTATVRGGSKLLERGRTANPVDLSGIMIVTTEEQWTSG